MNHKVFSRRKVTLLILLAYLLPIFGLSFLQADASRSWSLLGFGMVTAASGSFLFFWLLLTWEQGLSVSIPIPLIEKPPEPAVDLLAKGRVEELEKALQERQQQLDVKNNELSELHTLQGRQEKIFEEQRDAQQREFAVQRQHLLDDMDKQRQLLVEHYQTILEQRDILDRKTQQMTQLENKVRDLNYELKTILHLTEKTIPIDEIPASKPFLKMKQKELQPLVDTVVQSEEEAETQLKRCLEIAQSMTGASHYGNTSRFREFSAGHFALDQRRLFDRFRTEENSTIFVYSQTDNKMLFVNDRVKLLLGVTTERFVQGFGEIAAPGLQSWHEALQQLTFRNEVHLHLPLKTRFGEEVVLECLLGIVPTGLFRNQVIGILFAPHHLQARSKSI